MHHVPLASLAHRTPIGQALAFDVWAPDGSLLLAQGQPLPDADALAALLQRGARVALAAVQPAPAAPGWVPRQALPALWADTLRDLGDALAQTLTQEPEARLADALAQAAGPVLALVARDPDLAIFQVLRQAPGTDYGVQRSLQTAITSHLVAQRLGWNAADSARAFHVALTMNLSMLALQGELARQDSAPTQAQREALASHPMRSLRLLEAAGVRCALWLRAVLQHHECEDGSGYPSGRRDVDDLASLVRRADVYTGKLASRRSRAALAADVAGRQMFQQDPGHPMTQALVREFGLYPPGCQVRLANGARAIVVARGERLTTPRVACLTDTQGRSLPAPQRVDTHTPAHRVVAAVGEDRALTVPALDRLLAVLG